MSDCIYTTDIVLDKDGYPRIKWNKRIWRMNRLLWTFAYGEIPKGLVIGHKCNNSGCINVNHLYLTTREQNSTDAARDGLYFTGFHNKEYEHACSEWEHILFMYHVMGFSQQEIADAYNITQPRVSEIIRNNREVYLEKQGIRNER